MLDLQEGQRQSNPTQLNLEIEIESSSYCLKRNVDLDFCILAFIDSLLVSFLSIGFHRLTHGIAL